MTVTANSTTDVAGSCVVRVSLLCGQQRSQVSMRGALASTATSRVPKLTDLGVLPLGRHVCSASEVRRAFVDGFPESGNRAAIFGEWRSHRAALRSLTSVLFQWVDGSFVTDKVNPGDIDVVTFVDGPAFDRLPRWKRDVVEEICNGRGSKSYSRVDASIAAVFPRDDRRHEFYLNDRGYWDGMWSKYRSGGHKKGYLEVR